MPTSRVLSTVLIASIRTVVVSVENPAQNDASGAVHARVQLTRYMTRYLHDLVVTILSFVVASKRASTRIRLKITTLDSFFSLHNAVRCFVGRRRHERRAPPRGSRCHFHLGSV